MNAGSTIVVTLETGLVDQTIGLIRDPINANLYKGTHTVRPDDRSSDLSVKSIVALTNATDLAGNALITEIPEGHNLDENSDLVIMHAIMGSDGVDWIFQY